MTSNLNDWIEWLSSDVTIPVVWSIVVHICFIIVAMLGFEKMLGYLDNRM